MVNRNALILRYRDPAVRWINQADPSPDGNEITAADVNEERTGYLIDDRVGADPRLSSAGCGRITPSSSRENSRTGTRIRSSGRKIAASLCSAPGSTSNYIRSSSTSAQASCTTTRPERHRLDRYIDDPATAGIAAAGPEVLAGIDALARRPLRPSILRISDRRAMSPPIPRLSVPRRLGTCVVLRRNGSGRLRSVSVGVLRRAVPRRFGLRKLWPRR